MKSLDEEHWCNKCQAYVSGKHEEDAEFNLSEKRQDRKHPNPKKPYNNEFTYPEEDVKEFIRLLKAENMKFYEGEVTDDINKRIDKLAGEKLQ